jgi:UDPglucose--hexose-1-phosphate uridylyltransferase
MCAAGQVSAAGSVPPVTEPDARPPLRTDPLTGRLASIAASRQGRPNRPSTDCPFCPGGIEAPEPYDVRWFPNRWPPLPDGRAEVVLYSPVHDATFWSLGVTGARRVVDLWAERTASLGARPDVDYVLVFENRGAEVGATIPHPHGQIYGFDAVPPAPFAELERVDPTAFAPPAELVVTTAGRWRAWVPWASMWPYELVLAPDHPAPDLPGLDDAGRDDLAAALVDALARLDRLFDEPMPYMLWIHQRPTDGGGWPSARVHVHVAPLLRAPGTPRYVAAGELGSEVTFNPVDPVDAAAALRAAGPR